MNDEEYIGRFIKIYLKNGHIFHGSVIFWSDEIVKLKSVQNEIIVIKDAKDISAYIFIQKANGEFLLDNNIIKNTNERIKENETKEDRTEEDKRKLDEMKDDLEIKKINKIKDLIPLYNLKAEAERQAAKTKLNTSTITTPLVEYGDPISILRTFKDDTSK
jgi:hypothetical protein